MKKLLKYIICTALIISLFGAITVSAKEISDSNVMLEFLSKLEIINTDIDNSDSNVTRELFATYVARLLRIEQSSTDARYFVDIENNAFSTKAVNALVERGIITVGENRYFRPEDNITYNECIKMLVCAAGYETYAQLAGGYPTGYLKAAEELDIECRVEDANLLSVSEAAQLIYKTAIAPMMEISGMEKANIKYDAGDTVLVNYWDIYESEGTVTQIGGQSILPGTGFDIDEAKIGENTLYVAEGIYDDFLGSYVKYFYHSDGNGNDELVFLSNDICKADDISFDAFCLDSVSSTEVRYYNKDLTKKKRIAVDNPELIYNGRYLGESVGETINNLNKGSITIKDKNNDGQYDIVIIKDYKNFLVGNIDEYTNTIYNKLDTLPNELCLDDYFAVRLCNDVGAMLELKDLSKDSIISVAESRDGGYAHIIASSTEFNGIFQGSDNDGIAPSAVVNSELYYVDRSYMSEFNACARLGETYHFKLDAFGYISYVYVSPSEGDMQVGYVMSVKENNDENNVVIKILAEDGKFKKVSAAERVRIDGKTYKKDIIRAFRTALNVGGTEDDIENRVIRYVLNDEGLITEIDTLSLNTANETDMNSITKVYEKDTTDKVFSYAGATANSSRNFGRRAIMNTETVVFCIPVNNLNMSQEDCQVGDYKGVLKENISYYGNAYNFSSLNAYADVIVCMYDYADLDGNTSGSKYAFMIDKIYTGLNDDEEVITIVEGYQNGVKKKVTAPTSMNLSGLSRGDVVMFHYGLSGNIIPSFKSGVDDVILLHKATDQYPNWNISSATNLNGEGCRLYTTVASATNQYSSTFQASFGNVIKTIENCIFVAADGYSDIVESIDVSSMQIAVYDSDEDVVRAGTIDDIYDYKSSGINCSRIMYITRDNAGRALYVFN